MDVVARLSKNRNPEDLWKSASGCCREGAGHEWVGNGEEEDENR